LSTNDAISNIETPSTCKYFIISLIDEYSSLSNLLIKDKNVRGACDKSGLRRITTMNSYKRDIFIVLEGKT
jgi:hypothetical protein